MRSPVTVLQSDKGLRERSTIGIVVPSGENPTTPEACQVMFGPGSSQNLRISLPESVAQRDTQLLLGGAGPVALSALCHRVKNRVPSGLNRTSSTGPGCSYRFSCCPDFASQSRAVESSDTVSTRLLSGVNDAL